MKAKIYNLENANQQAHFPENNTTVAVCWNIREVKKTIIGEDKLKYTAEVIERVNGPYIDFVSLREYEKEEFCKDEDSPVVGGLSAKVAERIAEELLVALKYLKEQSE